MRAHLPTGRRRGRYANTTTATLLVCALGVTGWLAGTASGGHRDDVSVAQPTAGCSTRDLPRLGGEGGNVIAASSNGIYVGLADNASGVAQAVIWRGGRVSALHVNLASVTPTGVNRQGVVVGTGYDTAAEMLVGWWWAHGKTSRLAVRPGDIAMPEAIDDSGHVVGALIDDDEHADGPGADENERAAYWTSVAKVPEELAQLPGDDAAHAFAIAPDGTVGGVSLGSGGSPVLWRPGHPAQRLGGLAGPFGLVRGFDSRSRPVGDSASAGGGTHAVTWPSAGKPTDLGTLVGGRESLARAAGGGDVVGAAGAPTADGGALTRPVLWANGRALTLPLAASAGFRPVAGTANDAVEIGGELRVVGYMASLPGSRRPTEWRCAS